MLTLQTCNSGHLIGNIIYGKIIKFIPQLLNKKTKSHKIIQNQKKKIKRMMIKIKKKNNQGIATVVFIEMTNHFSKRIKKSK